MRSEVQAFALRAKRLSVSLATKNLAAIFGAGTVLGQQARSGNHFPPRGARFAGGDGDRNDEAASLAAALLGHGAEM